MHIVILSKSFFFLHEMKLGNNTHFPVPHGVQYYDCTMLLKTYSINSDSTVDCTRREKNDINKLLCNYMVCLFQSLSAGIVEWNAVHQKSVDLGTIVLQDNGASEKAFAAVFAAAPPPYLWQQNLICICLCAWPDSLDVMWKGGQ